MNELLNDIPYCGLAPVPAEIWTRWNFDLALIATLAVLMTAHGLRLKNHMGPLVPSERRHWPFFIAGWAAVALGLIAPLCALGVALFSARVTQHMWLTLIAAPLLALAVRGTRVRTLVGPLAAAGLFAAALWAWHLPLLYDLTFRSDLAYWLMHISLTGAAMLLWRAIFLGRPDAWLGRLAAGIATTVLMGLLGALITFAPRLLYQAHLLTAQSWGLSPLQDQQLGGLIMWVPAGMLLLVTGLVMVYRVLAIRPGEGEVENPLAH